LLAILFVYTWWSIFVLQCNLVEIVHFKHSSISRSMLQKIMIHHKLGNFILFKLCMEPTVFNIVIKRNKRKYGATFSVVMAESISNALFLPWKISMQEPNCKFCPIYLHLLPQGKKMSHFIFETRLLITS
jgi:hypothetical protein